ncbi:MAG: STAS domain-containing protein [Phycisphaerae bacterium]
MTFSSRIIVKKIGKVAVVDFVDAAIMDMQQIQQITEELENLVDHQDQKFLLLDFSSVKFLSSQVLGLMLKLHQNLSARNGWLGICGLRKDIHKIFRLTRLDQIFHFYDNEQSALEAVGVYIGG